MTPGRISEIEAEVSAIIERHIRKEGLLGMIAEQYTDEEYSFVHNAIIEVITYGECEDES